MDPTDRPHPQLFEETFSPLPRHPRDTGPASFGQHRLSLCVGCWALASGMPSTVSLGPSSQTARTSARPCPAWRLSGRMWPGNLANCEVSGRCGTWGTPSGPEERRSAGREDTPKHSHSTPEETGEEGGLTVEPAVWRFAARLWLTAPSGYRARCGPRWPLPAISRPWAECCSGDGPGTLLSHFLGHSRKRLGQELGDFW